jgi:hypothetical protein
VRVEPGMAVRHSRSGRTATVIGVAPRWVTIRDHASRRLRRVSLGSWVPVPAVGRGPRENPMARETREIYPEIEAIYARKTTGPWRGRYVHHFKAGSRICGTPSGDLLVTSAPRCPA